MRKTTEFEKNGQHFEKMAKILKKWLKFREKLSKN